MQQVMYETFPLHMPRTVKFRPSMPLIKFPFMEIWKAKNIQVIHIFITNFVQPSRVPLSHPKYSFIFNSMLMLIQIRHRQSIHDLHLPTKSIKRNLGVLRAQLARLDIGNEYEVISEQSMALGDIILLGDLRSSLANVNDERILDAEDGIGGFVGIIAEVQSTRILSVRHIKHIFI